MDVDHGIISNVDEIAISKFKATCLGVLEKVRRTGEPVRVTRFGKPIADILPPAPTCGDTNWLGAMAGTGRVTGDIISPAAVAEEWEALRD